jgi:hypothetical protein
MYSFHPEVKVPKNIVCQIGDDIRIRFLEKVANHIRWIRREDHEMLDELFRSVVYDLTNNRDKSSDGWVLDERTVDVIANEMTQFQKIGAIREFRSITGASLRESKEFIEKFGASGKGPLAAKEFRRAFGVSS